jgi:5-methylcytosine-specific restriction protein A
MATDNTLWSDEELKDAVFAYKKMQQDLDSGKPIVKRAVYKALSEKWGRTENSYERRMSNISAVLDLYGRAWIKGLKPLSNVGSNVISVINKYLNEFDGATDFIDAAFEVDVAKKVKSGFLIEPKGNQNPVSIKAQVSLIARDPDVKAWVLIKANGICESCNTKAPFVSSTGIPYLEVHHVKRLADKGPDTIDNAVAVCPNCHKALHYSDSRDVMVDALYKQISRLKQ